MGYERFDQDDNLVRPLYGYLGDIRDGKVPPWVETPTLSADAVAELFELERESYDAEIASDKLPESVSRNSRGRGLTKYKVEKQAYLDQHRSRANAVNDTMNSQTVRFELDTDDKESSFGTTYNSFPDEVRDRLAAIKATSSWDQRIDGYHQRFTGWVLEYSIGARGGIQEAKIVADIKH